jgi:CP family cyanate transporter-like MFS transporter
MVPHVDRSAGSRGLPGKVIRCAVVALLAQRARSPATIGLAAIVFAALNLRLGQVQVAPVLEQIRDDTGMSSAVAGMLGTIIVLCMGVFAFAGAPVIRRIGTSATIGLSLWLIALGSVGRAVMPTAEGMLALTFPIGIGIALIGVALPSAIKRDFAARAASITGLYIAALSTGATFAALATVPLSNLLGGWRWALAAGSVFAFAALPLWRLRPERAAERPEPVEPAVPRRGPGAQGMLLGAIFAAQSFVFSALIGWIAVVYLDAGWTEQEAAIATATIPVATVVTALLTPRLTSPGSRRWWTLATGVSMTIGLTGIAIAPTTLPVIWLAFAGFALGAILPLVMMMPLDLRDDPTDVATLTGWMLGIGYTVGAAGPAFVGALRDATGGFTVPVLVLAGVGLVMGLLALAPPLRPGR